MNWKQLLQTILQKKKKLSLELRRKSQDLRKDLEQLTETESFQREESFAKVQVEHDNLTKFIEKTQNRLSQLREDEEKLMSEISDLEDQAAKEAAIIESSLKLDLKGELKQSDPILQLTCIWEKLLAKRDQEKERLKDVLKEQKVRLQEMKEIELENARERKRKIGELEEQQRSQEDMLRERKKLKMAISLAMNERNQLRDEKSGSELLSDDAIIEQATREVNSQYATMQDTLKQIESRVASCESENALRKSRVVSLLKMDDSLGLNAGQKVSKMSIGAVGQILMRVLGENIELSSLNEDERKVLEGEKTTLDYLEQMGIIDTSNDCFIKMKN